VPLDFTAIDFETANGNSASACAVGLVKVRGGQIVDTYSTLINPPTGCWDFHPGNIRVHGIYPKDVENAPAWPEVLAQMLDFIEGDVLIAHNASFDMGVLRKTTEAVGGTLPELHYACSLLISRKTYNLDSYRLNQVAYAVGHEEFDHHEALADSDACARIVIHAAKRHGADDLAGLLAETKQQLKPLNLPTDDGSADLK
jgi:DNA polymerase-3 subunit epsilon